MTNRLDTLLHRGFDRWVDESSTPQNNGCFRGGNIPMYDGTTFLSDNSSHCPRAALARLWGYSTLVTPSNRLSFEIGRAFENVFTKALMGSGVNGLVLEQEEEVQINVEIDGVVRFTQRPDGVVTDPGSPSKFAIETKSVQSGGTAEAIFMHHKPKLGAAMQLAGVMSFLQLSRGYIVYGLQSYMTHYSFVQKRKLSFVPSIKTFECVWLGDMLVVEGRKSIVRGSRIIAGIKQLCAVADGQAPLPAIPEWVDLFGDKAKYPGCNFCPWRGPCATMTTARCETVEAFRSEIEIQGASDGQED